ncbi:MAG: hypothetical protein ACRD10_11585 [Terriglobia bacterium]
MTSEIEPNEAYKPLKSLAETFRQGLAPLAVRRKGAVGEIPVPPVEKIEILVALASDPEEEVRGQALQTLAAWPASELCGILAAPAAPREVLLFAARQMARDREDILEALLENSALDIDLQNTLLASLGSEPGKHVEQPPENTQEHKEESTAGGEETAPTRQTTLQRISRMNPAQRIKCALTGSQEERFILIRDSNKMVARAALQSPKLSEAEIESYASMKNVSEEVLRMIAANRAFMKSYAVIRALVNNPRTPIDVAVPLLSRMNDRDMRSLGMNRNVPDALRTTAAKTLMARQSSRGSSLRR